MSLPAYAYTDLQDASSEIRLLKIAGPKQFELQTHPLDKAPPYQTLSYTRPMPNENDSGSEIRINERTAVLEIPGNLHKALEHVLCQGDRTQNPVYIWADAICINQANIRELRRQ